MRDRGARITALVLSPLVAGGALAAHAHTGGGAFILLLPTHLYVIAGTLVVAVSFVLVVLVPARVLDAAGELDRRLFRFGGTGTTWLGVTLSLLSLAIVLILVIAGLAGSRDPLANPLPLVLWSVWWIGLTLLHAVVGDLWSHLNPWIGLYRLMTARGALRGWRQAPPPDYPARAGYWPAVLGLGLFAWFELIHPAPADPAILAGVVLGYLLATFVGVFLFGEAWLQHAEVFSVFFRMISWLAPLGPWSTEPGCGGCRLACREGRDCLNCARCATALGPSEVLLTLPAMNLLRVRPLPASGVAFVLLALASVSFDGLSRTFAWLGSLGVNPLAYPGRTELMTANTLGLAGLWAVLAGVYVVVLVLGRAVSGSGALGGTLALSIVPIAFGYHAAHYLPVLLVDTQYALRAVSDPFGLGWDLFGTAARPVITSFLTDPATLYPLWYVQVALITSAHVAAVVVAHTLMVRSGAPRAKAVLAQAPMTAVMVGYTVFGLWLLATPSIG